MDCLQLEKGTGASKYNLIENGASIGSSNGWTLSMGASYLDGEIKLDGDIFHSVTASQTVKVNKPLNTTFVISGWASANSVALNTADRTYGIKVTLNYDDDSSEDTFVSFSSDNTGKQFASGAVVSTKTDTDVTILSATVSLC